MAESQVDSVSSHQVRTPHFAHSTQGFCRTSLSTLRQTSIPIVCISITSATPVGIVLHGDPPMPLISRLMEMESVVAFKEEYNTIYSLQLYRSFGKRITLFAGGEKARLLTYYPYGMRAWYSTFMTFAPSVAIQFWNAIRADDLKRAGEIVLRYETPVSQRWSHAFWRATCEHFGTASRWVRGPETAFNDEQMKELATFFKSPGLFPLA